MATKRVHGIVPGDVSEIHDEPQTEGSRISVRVIQARVEERGRSPEVVADQLDLDLGDVYAALAYYHNNPAEMRQVKERHEQAAAEAARQSSVRPPLVEGNTYRLLLDEGIGGGQERPVVFS